MLDREGADGPGDVAFVGDESAVADQIHHLADIGVTDFTASPYGPDEDRARTMALLSELATKA